MKHRKHSSRQRSYESSSRDRHHGHRSSHHRERDEKDKGDRQTHKIQKRDSNEAKEDKITNRYDFSRVTFGRIQRGEPETVYKGDRETTEYK